jgi:hypothetical protein
VEAVVRVVQQTQQQLVLVVVAEAAHQHRLDNRELQTLAVARAVRVEKHHQQQAVAVQV